MSYKTSGYLALDFCSAARTRHSVRGRWVRELGYEVVLLDLADASICCDVLQWDYSVYPVGYFDVVWASPPAASCGRLAVGAGGVAAGARARPFPTTIYSILSMITYYVVLALSACVVYK